MKTKLPVLGLASILAGQLCLGQSSERGEDPAATNSSVHPTRRGPGGVGSGRAAALPTGVKVERNIPYVVRGHRNQVLDLFLPEQSSAKPLPLMIWIHGGAWMAGSQANPPVLYLVGKGFVVASIQYRFSQDAIWPAQAFDCKAAIRFLRAEAAKFHLDPNHFGEFLSRNLKIDK